jgi:hypothetical protein
MLKSAPPVTVALLLVCGVALLFPAPCSADFSINYGQAAPFAVFQVGGGGSTAIGNDINNTAIINGLEAIGPYGRLNAQKTTVNGQVYLDTQVFNAGNYTKPANMPGGQKDFFITGSPQFVVGDLGQARADARSLSIAAAAAAGQTSLGNYDFGTGSILTLSHGVYSATDFDLNGAILTITGGVNDTFVLNDSGGFGFSQSQIVLSGGITRDNVLFNVTGTGSLADVNKSNSIFQGTLLAEDRNITLDNLGVGNPGDNSGFYGRVIGADGLTLTIHSGAQVFGPSGTAVVPAPSSLLLAGSGGIFGIFLLAARWRSVCRLPVAASPTVN